MKFKFVRIISAVLMVAVILCAVGCEFGTYVKTDQTPKDSVTGFFDCVKSKNFAACDQYLANDASFEIINQTGYTLADIMLDARISGLSYEIMSQPVVNGVDASCIVNVTAPDVFSVEEAMSQEYSKMKNRYVKDNKLKEFPSDDKEIVNEVAINAFNAVVAQAQPSSVEVVVKLSFEDSMWKIIVTDELCVAILGEVASNEE